MRRFLTLIRFEMVKVLARKKAFLFLLALNVVPLLASIVALLIYLKLKGWGLGGFEFSVLVEMVRGLFIAHMVVFAWISPFFLALVIGDSVSGEAGRGSLKILLLTPVERWQVVVAKAVAVLVFLMLAVALGGFFLQLDLWVARAMTESPAMRWDVKTASTALVETTAALQLFVLSFLSHLALVGFFLVFAQFSESPIMMAFISLIVLMTMQVYVLMAPHLAHLDPRFGQVADWCFTRHLSKLSSIETVQGILDQRLSLWHPDVWQPLRDGLGWAAFFFAVAILLFRRRPILN